MFAGCCCYHHHYSHCQQARCSHPGIEYEKEREKEEKKGRVGIQHYKAPSIVTICISYLATSKQGENTKGNATDASNICVTVTLILTTTTIIILWSFIQVNQC